MATEGMQQNAEQIEDAYMNSFTQKQERLQVLRQSSTLSRAHDSSLESLANAAEVVELKQGQTLLRGGVMETHAFLLLEGTVRLLGNDPLVNELFT